MHQFKFLLILITLPLMDSCSNGLQLILAAGESLQVMKGGQDGFTALIKSIADKQKEARQPFYILDLGVVVRLMAKWTTSLPQVQPYYAVKCNNEPTLLVALAALGANFDCATMAEIETLLGLGVGADRIVFANPCKAESHIKYAAKVGVNLTTFDSKLEIDKIKRCHPKCDLLLRIKPPNDDKCSWRPLGAKFGALPEEVAPLLQYAHEACLNVAGVSFHVGSKATQSQVYRGAIAASRAVFDASAHLKLSHKMHILNIGGGFKAIPLFDEIASTINEALKEYFPADGKYSDMVIIAEPGRFFVETAFTYVTNIIGKRVRGEVGEYWIDDGIYGAFNLPAYDKSSMMVKPLLRNAEKYPTADLITCSSTIFGPTCDSLDMVLTDCKLPELHLNDLLVFYNMGAYTASAGTKFNGFNSFAISTYLAYTNE